MVPCVSVHSIVYTMPDDIRVRYKVDQNRVTLVSDDQIPLCLPTVKTSKQIKFVWIRELLWKDLQYKYKCNLLENIYYSVCDMF